MARPEGSSATSRLADARRSRPRLAVFAFRFAAGSAHAQTKTSLRFSRPYAGKAVCLLRATKNPRCTRVLNGSP